MIRYTSDPQTNMDILLKNINPIDMEYTNNIKVPEQEAVSGVVPTEPYIDVPFKSVLRLPSEDPFNKFQKGLNIGGKYVPNDNPNVPNDNITVPMQTKEMQINNIRKELDRLDKEEEKYNKERQAKRDYYNSDAFLSRVYQLDPNTAQFLAGRRDMQTKRDLEESKIESNRLSRDAVYTPEQKRLIDAKEQNRLEMQNVSKSARTAKIQQDKDEYERWSKAYDALKTRDIELTKALAATGLTGYDIAGTDYTKFGGMETEQNPPASGSEFAPAASGLEKSNYDKAKDIVIKALAIDNQGYTTKEKKENATQNLLNYNVSLGQFPLTDNEKAALENLIKNANIMPAAATRPKTSNSEASKLAYNSLGEVIKWSEASKLDPNNEADRLLLAKMKSRSYANEAYMTDDANLSGSTIRQFFGNLTNVRTIPVEDAEKYKKEIPDNYRRAVNMAMVFTKNDYIDRISKTLADNIKNTIDNYPLYGSSSTTKTTVTGKVDKNSGLTSKERLAKLRKMQSETK